MQLDVCWLKNVKWKWSIGLHQLVQVAWDLFWVNVVCYELWAGQNVNPDTQIAISLPVCQWCLEYYHRPVLEQNPLSHMCQQKERPVTFTCKCSEIRIAKIPLIVHGLTLDGECSSPETCHPAEKWQWIMQSHLGVNSALPTLDEILSDGMKLHNVSEICLLSQAYVTMLLQVVLHLVPCLQMG